MVSPQPVDGPHSAADAFVALLGLRLLDWADGEARVELQVGPQHLNAIGRLHGGALFSLADAAMARASNRPGQPSVVTSATMQFLRATVPGDRLIAHAVREHEGRRLSAYRVEVRHGDRLVATMTSQAMEVGTR